MDLFHEVVHVDDAVGEFRLRRLAHGGPQADDLVVLGLQLAVFGEILGLPDGLQPVVEQEHVKFVAGLPAHHVELRTVVLAGVERADVPCHPHAEHAVERGVGVHHVVEHIEAGIAVIALRKRREGGAEAGIQRFPTGVEQRHLLVEERHLGPIGGILPRGIGNGGCRGAGIGP